MQADPMAFYIGNILKRVLHIIRVQCRSLNLKLAEDTNSNGEDYNPLMEMDSLKFLIGDDSYSRGSKEVELEKFPKTEEQLKEEENAINEFQAQLEESLLIIQNEIEEAYQSITDHCSEQIQANDTILTIGYSNILFEFFKEASKMYDFSVIVTENSPGNTGTVMARKLKREGIKCILISDTSVFAYMSKISKVIISTRAIMADGGLIADSGVELVVLAADFHSVPVIVVSTLYKLTPLYPFDNTSYNKYISPELVLNSKLIKNKEKVDIIVPKYDYIEPEYISLYITNFGCHTPKYIYREFAEYYSKEELQNH
uniref:Translation initiation factor eIF2B subunit beta n=1 Tax=Euplotes harpa TaxID=151035 RepID=A0A7S3JM12_9SPIT|mmetsp:Transcript_5117/g.6047  ORF Transcript_5117/g.6047 Transcript_5117/m.6047 type:complete len:314 (+) Transcript_5117:223-1164(+)